MTSKQEVMDLALTLAQKMRETDSTKKYTMIALESEKAPSEITSVGANFLTRIRNNVDTLARMPAKHYVALIEPNSWSYINPQLHREFLNSIHVPTPPEFAVIPVSLDLFESIKFDLHRKGLLRSPSTPITDWTPNLLICDGSAHCAVPAQLTTKEESAAVVNLGY